MATLSASYASVVTHPAIVPGEHAQVVDVLPFGLPCEVSLGNVISQVLLLDLRCLGHVLRRFFRKSGLLKVLACGSLEGREKKVSEKGQLTHVCARAHPPLTAKGQLRS